MPPLLTDLIDRARGVPDRWRVPVRSGLRAVSFKHAFWSGLTGLFGILAIHFVTTWSGQPLLIGSFGASAVLLFGVPDSALSQPRNLVGGHVLSALVAVATVALVGSGPLAIALAVGLSMFVMSLTRTLHPPGGATALIGVQGAAGLGFVVVPVLAGSLILLAMALVTNNVVRHRRYPLHWL
ncbi:MAG: HPP family protein [Planctomycetaceae bacterium]|nr:HPP family protein [Planctomycetaceae bacterium]